MKVPKVLDQLPKVLAVNLITKAVWTVGVGTVLLLATRDVQGDTLDTLRNEVQTLKEQVEKLQEKLNSFQGAERKPSATKATSETGMSLSLEEKNQLSQEVTEKVLDKFQPNLAVSASGSANAFHPAISLGFDNALSVKEGNHSNFEFRTVELGFLANIDPFARGYAFITGSPDGVDVEEAAIVTTTLPYNLNVKGGRFFADFGRLSKFHDHDLPFVNRPLALDRFIDGESQADGLEVNYLVPMDQYFSLTAGAYNKIGAENDRVDNSSDRSFAKFSYLGRAATFFNINDENSIDFGGSYVYTPEIAMENDSSRQLAGLDLTYRYIPLSQATYHGFTWGTEILFNHERRPEGGFPAAGEMVSDLPMFFHSQEASSLYSYVEVKVSRRLSPGFLFDYAEDINGMHGATYTYSPFLTIWLSEFQRLRAQYSLVNEDQKNDNQFYLQWTGFLGSHVHGFRER